MKIKKIKLSIFQRMSLKMFQSYKIPKVTKLSGTNSIENLPIALKNDNLKKVLIVISKTILNSGLVDKFFSILDKMDILYILHTGIQSDPNISSIEEGLNIYTENGCQGIVAIGGGSVLDYSKILALRVTNPNKTILQMTNYLCVTQRSAPIYAIPTTAGTGSEITVFAVVTDEKKNKKCPVITDMFIPKVIVLDPKLTLSLPPNVTAYSGIDAFAHAIEAYISKFSNAFPNHKKMALPACMGIYENLPKVYKNPNDINARFNMLNSSFFAGVAFSQIELGYIHAIAHRLGEFYHLPHGKAIAIVLPYVLRAYMPEIEISLAQIAIVCKIGTEKDSYSTLAQTFINEISELNKVFSIEEKVPAFKESDLKEIVKRVQNEAKWQGSPKSFSNSELEKLILEIVH